MGFFTMGVFYPWVLSLYVLPVGDVLRVSFRFECPRISLFCCVCSHGIFFGRFLPVGNRLKRLNHFSDPVFDPSELNPEKKAPGSSKITVFCPWDARVTPVGMFYARRQ